MISTKKVLLVASGKGGVGKSTVAVNLSIALGLLGLSVGLLDADIYGPSVPIMLGLRRLSPRIHVDQGKEKVLPFTKFGIKAISIGFFIEEAQNLLWRGPAVHTALQKMLQEVEWGDLDILIIDLPPGTGDVPLSLSQLLPKNLHGLIVCTPQEVAMLDAIKAINTFYQLNIPLVGIVENMSGFTPPGQNMTYPIFGVGSGKELANRFNTPLLSSIPILPAIREGGDIGYPSAFHQAHNGAGSHFTHLAEKVLRTLN